VLRKNVTVVKLRHDRQYLDWEIQGFQPSQDKNKDTRFRLVVGLVIDRFSKNKFDVLVRAAAQGFTKREDGSFVLHGKPGKPGMYGRPDKCFSYMTESPEFDMLEMADYYGRMAVAIGGPVLITTVKMDQYVRIDDNGQGKYKLSKMVEFDGKDTERLVASGQWIFSTMRQIALQLAPGLELSSTQPLIEDSESEDDDW
jgi:hypothetical protein